MKVTMGFEYVDIEFEKCPDCGKEQQLVDFKKLVVIVLRHDDKIRGYKCGWCRGKLTEK